jgi:predicted unusual protein kinase regulating ubiquinone biosynthesis (AarF/ABC1/UbiB family)
MSGREAPTVSSSATRRALRMAAMSAGVTGSYLGYLAQRLFLGEDARDRKLKATHERAARRMTSGLGALRGPAMKLGQALSIQSGMLPAEMLTELTSLQSAAPPMHPSLVRAQFKAAMGAYPETIFREFSPEPMAAASLGQVHVAVTRRAQRVAVKIQYPAIAEAITADFRWFRTLLKASGQSRLFSDDLIAELEAQITAETNYEREADDIDLFHGALRPLGYVRVPVVHREYSGDRVITMTLLEGEHIERFLARRPTQRQRDVLGERLLELYYFQVLRLAAFHADPHWGNYLFGADGSIGLVDFGAVKRLPAAFVENLHRVFLYPGNRSGAEFGELIDERFAISGMKLSTKARAAHVRFAREFYASVYPPEPEKEEVAINFGNIDVVKQFMRFSADFLSARAVLPEYVMLGRAETGLYQTLNKLGARVRTSKIVRRQLAAAKD